MVKLLDSIVYEYSISIWDSLKHSLFLSSGCLEYFCLRAMGVTILFRWRFAATWIICWSCVHSFCQKWTCIHVFLLKKRICVHVWFLTVLFGENTTCAHVAGEKWIWLWEKQILLLNFFYMAMWQTQEGISHVTVLACDRRKLNLVMGETSSIC